MATINTYIHTFAPESYRVIKPIPVTLRRDRKECVASWFDANMHTSGNNVQEAFDNLRSLVVETYEALTQTDQQRLGPKPLRQRAVLEEYIRSREETSQMRQARIEQCHAVIEGLRGLLRDATPEQLRTFEGAIRRR